MPTDADYKLSSEQIRSIWASAETKHGEQIKRRDYYNGQQEILNKTGKRKDGQSYYKIVMNWVEDLVGRHVGFLTTRPFSVVADEDKADAAAAVEQYDVVAQANDLPATDGRHFRNCLLYGTSVEVMSYDAATKSIGLTDFPPYEWAFVTDEYGTVVAAVRRFELAKDSFYDGKLLEDIKIRWTVYDADEILEYEEADDHTLLKIPALSQSHEFGIVPVYRWMINADGQPAITDSFITLQDAYNSALSAHFDDHEADIDAILLITGLDPHSLFAKDDDGKSVMDNVRETKTLPLATSDSKADFLTRDLPVEKTRFTLDTARSDIHTTGKAPDLREIVGTTGATSGIALKLAFQSMIEVSGDRIKYIRESLDRRIVLLNTVWSKRGGVVLVDNYAITVSFEVPLNELEIWNSIEQLEPILSRLDRAKLVPSIEDPRAAIDAKDAEIEETGGGGASQAGTNATETAGTPIDAVAAEMAEQSESPDELITLAETELEPALFDVLLESAPQLSKADIEALIEALLAELKKAMKGAKR